MNQLTIYDEYLTDISKSNSFSNRAFLYGESLFTTIRISHSKPLFLEEHLERITASLEFLYRTKIPKNIRKNILKICEKFIHGKLRITFYQESNYEDLVDKDGIIQLVYFVKELEHDFLENISNVKLCFADARKTESLIPSFLKNGNYILQSLEKENAQKNNYDDVLFLTHDGFITESSTSNILLRKGDCFYTPASSSMVLDGITKKILCRGMIKENFKVKFESLKVEKLSKIDECWLLSSIVGIQNIAQIENTSYNVDNNWTNKLIAILKEEIENE
ncbi:MAG: aminotransferase class IV [Bacteriovoracaceae bacterium]|jgi:4-amino-4-deoxychorismate lyase|nr:aminotransferase class IV [Bacteriovoracaceae bacterium]